MLTVYHIPVCPFCQRLEILLELKGLRHRVRFEVIDITEPRPLWLLEKTRGTTQLPVLETAEGRIIKESLVILQYLEDLFPEPAVAQKAPYARAVENMLVRLEAEFADTGYRFILNQDRVASLVLHDKMLLQYAKLNEFLLTHAPQGPFLFQEFGWAETVFTPLFMRFWFLEYYENFKLPHAVAYARVSAWRDACMAHPAAQQVTQEQIIKLYYDYAKGAGNGALPKGRSVSSFKFKPDWRERPLPPQDKYGHDATDAELGLM